MNRIDLTFQDLKKSGRKGLVVYIGAGDPDLAATEKLALAFDKAGVDILELGVPFSDPLADGIVNQLAAQRGLASGTTPGGVLETVRSIRKNSCIPIVLYIYFNIIFKRGVQRFIADAAASGVDGLLVLDLPPEESENYASLMKAAEMCPIYLIAPTTPEARMSSIVREASGFIYYVSREGVTGMQKSISSTVADMTAKIRKYSSLPIAIGFGVSNAEQAREVAAHGEAVVVGSAIVNQIAEHGSNPDMVSRVAGFVATLAEGLKKPV